MLLHHIKGLVVRDNITTQPIRGSEMSHLNIIENAWLWLENGIIKDYGSMDNCPTSINETYNASHRFVLPSWCDSHTHIVFAGSREMEFIDKIKGVPYEEIARRGGGILNSAARLANTDESELYDLANQRINEVIHTGTGAVEIKSGYGLSLDAELKMLRVIRRLRENMPLPIKATFLGAHSVPAAYKSDREAYIQLIIKEMLPRIHDEQLADYIDVFCEKVAFSADETKRIIEAGAKYGLKAKIHSNQFNSMGGIEAAVAQGAVSVDHLEVLNDEEISVLQKSSTIATLLPSAPFFINDPNFPPARRILDANIAVALASDYNPGSSPSGNMNFVLSLACIKLRMSPEEAINAATFNGAAAMELAKDYGSITRGKVANLIVTRPIPSLAYLPYKFGDSQIANVILKGEWK
jgi:imidazolonepropionase